MKNHNLVWRNEGNVLFNDKLSTFYLQLYGARHEVKYHRDSERGNPLLPHGLLFLINSKGSFICTIQPTDRIAHTTAFVTPVAEHWLEWEIAQWVHAMKDRSDDPSHHEWMLLPQQSGLISNVHNYIYVQKSHEVWVTTSISTTRNTLDTTTLISLIRKYI